MVDYLKNELRKKVKELKSNYSFEEKKKKSEAIFQQIEQDRDFKRAHIVLAYWSMPDEVYTHDFIKKWASTKTFLLPVVDGSDLILKKFEGVDKMKEEGKYKILEPQGDAFTDFDMIDYAIIPGVAFDKFNSRLGRGKGYYDKTLGKLEAKKIGVCFDFQYFDVVPVDQYDIPMDFVVTDNYGDDSENNTIT
ncbi:MAG: 5-formyltetrahydrofolate cyclo-ligase [Bacteroidetes bacterium]|nr:MAG: 5-formyltetrahydrofolate cyclo-ligase [Bacteroidota bacterium]